MKILFVVDQLPYPPRNGVTIPTFNFISRLNSKVDVSLLFVDNGKQQIDHEQLAENKKYVKNLWVIELFRVSKYRRVKDELLLNKPYFLGWSCDTVRLRKLLHGHAFDVVWGCPLNVTETVDSISKILYPRPIYIAGINDCRTSFYRTMGKSILQKGLESKTRVLYVLFWLRSWLLGRMEARILKEYNLVLSQTSTERMWLNKISNGKLDRKTMVLPNGVNEVLFDIPIEQKGRDILFFAILEGIYEKVLLWVLKNVWPEVRNADRETRLIVVGKGASHELKKKMRADDRIVHKEYVPEICDVFRGKAITLAPVFKGYGLINKVIESMAAGIPVIGDSGSFNGIPGFIDGQHGIIANDAKSMATEIFGMLNSNKKQTDIANAARFLVRKYFSWEDRVTQITERFKTII